jgi:hypothetical protein
MADIAEQERKKARSLERTSKSFTKANQIKSRHSTYNAIGVLEDKLMARSDTMKKLDRKLRDHVMETYQEGDLTFKQRLAQHIERTQGRNGRTDPFTQESLANEMDDLIDLHGQMNSYRDQLDYERVVLRGLTSMEDSDSSEDDEVEVVKKEK